MRKEVTEHLSNLDIITQQHVSADDINTHGETTNTSHPSDSSVGQPVNVAMGSVVSVHNDNSIRYIYEGSDFNFNPSIVSGYCTLWCLSLHL